MDVVTNLVAVAVVVVILMVILTVVLPVASDTVIVEESWDTPITPSLELRVSDTTSHLLPWLISPTSTSQLEIMGPKESLSST